MIAARGKNLEMVSLLRHAGAADCVIDSRSMQEQFAERYNPRLRTGMDLRLVKQWKVAILSTQSGLYSAAQCAVNACSPSVLGAIVHYCVSDIPWPALKQDGAIAAARVAHPYAPYMSNDGMQLLQLGPRPVWQGTYTGQRRRLVSFRCRARANLPTPTNQTACQL